jgi:transposase
MAYSLDFREHVFKVKQQGQLTFQEVSERFSIPIRTLFRWQQRIEPKTKRNKPSTKIDMEALSKDVRDNPDHYQHERAKTFGVSQSAIFYALKRLNISNKKNAVPS